MLGIITFGLGVIVTVVTGVIRSRVSADVSSIVELTADIEKIEELGVAYWSRSGRDDDDRVLEGRIHGALNATRFFDAERICGCYVQRFRELDVELADAVTGDSFETADKTIDPAKITLIMELSHRLRAHLRTVRRAKFWAH